jgi:hypothetical protein
MKCLCMSGAIGWSRYADKSENKKSAKEVKMMRISTDLVVKCPYCGCEKKDVY